MYTGITIELITEKGVNILYNHVYKLQKQSNLNGIYWSEQSRLYKYSPQLQLRKLITILPTCTFQAYFQLFKT